MDRTIKAGALGVETCKDTAYVHPTRRLVPHRS